MADDIIKLTAEHAARAEDTAPVASNADATAGAIFERRDPVKTLAMQPKIVDVLSTIFDPEFPSISTNSASSTKSPSTPTTGSASA